MPSVAIGLVLAMLQAPQASTDLACVMDQISTADRTALVEGAVREAESTGAAGDRLSDAAASCGMRLGWEPQRAGDLAALSYAWILRTGSSQRLAGNGISVDQIEQWFARQSLAARTEIATLERPIDQLIQQLIAGGRVPNAASEQAALVGIYLGARLMIERFERGLPTAE